MTGAQIAIRLSREQVKRLDRVVRALRTSRSEVVRRALESYFYRLECERDAKTYENLPLTEHELALADDPRAWKGTPEW